jgi:Ras-related protein Rab-2A
MNFEYIYKYIIIGDSGVGKSCILLQFTQNEFDQNKENTVGVEFGNKIISVDGLSVKLQIWDTAGQEQFKSITRSYYRAVAGALLVYDVTNPESFANVKKWLDEAKQNANPELVVILCGNKIDLPGERKITTDQGKRLAGENQIFFMECSAKSRIKIDELFLTVAGAIKEKVDSGKIDATVEEHGVRKMESLVGPKHKSGKKLGSKEAQPDKKKKKCC